MFKYLALATCFSGTLLGATAFLLSTAGCNSETSSTSSLATTPDASGSATMTVASVVGGAISSTSSDTIALNHSNFTRKPSFYANLKNLFFNPLPDALAFSVCPTAKNPENACSVSGNTLTLTYGTSGCTIQGSSAIWVGGTALTTTGAAPVCGTFPKMDGNLITTLQRSYLGSIPGGNPTARTNAQGTETVALDTSPTLPGWQYQVSSVSGANGAENGYILGYVSHKTEDLSIAIRTVAYGGSLPSIGNELYDHTLATSGPDGTNVPLFLQTMGSGDDVSHVVNGTLYLQHNLAKTTAKTIANSVVHPQGCCYPISGSYTTSFTGGPNDGKTETLIFNSQTCELGTLGQAKLIDITGATRTVTLTHCL